MSKEDLNGGHKSLDITGTFIKEKRKGEDKERWQDMQEEERGEMKKRRKKAEKD